VSKPSIIAVIPARYQSSRFLGKPLVDIGGKSMIQRVYEQAQKSNRLSKVIIATDDHRIQQHAQAFHAEVIMTKEHPNGTSRSWEAIEKSVSKADFILNIQGDEPFIEPAQIDQLCDALNPSIEIATMAKKISDLPTLFDPNTVKVVFNKQHRALYFTRSTIPYCRDTAKQAYLQKTNFYKHIGIYAYQYDVLSKLVKLKASSLEEAECLEQLRWIEHGFDIQMVCTDYESIGIDTPEDIKKVSHLIK